jgi:uncharacterized protein (TIRG00374 family)
MNRRLLFNAGRAAISLGLIALLLWLMRDSLDEVVAAIRDINKVYFAVSFALIATGYFLLSLRLKVIMAAQRLKIKMGQAISWTLIGQFFSNFLPTAVGGDLVKAFYAASITGKKPQCFASVVFDRMLGTFTLILMLLLAYLFVKDVPHDKSITTFLIVVTAASAAVIAILFSRRIARRIPLLNKTLRRFKLEEKMKTLYGIIYNYKKHPRLIVNAILISIALQAVMFSAIYMIIRGMGWHVPIKTVLMFMPIISTVSMAPSINGLGVREGTFVLLFGPLMTKEAAFAMSLLYYLLVLVISLIGGGVYLFDKQYHLKPKEVLQAYDR